MFLWGERVGRVAYDHDKAPVFAFDENYQKNGLEVSPILYSGNSPQIIKNNSKSQTFRGLPGFIADALPDNYGNRVVDSFYLKKYGIKREEVTVLHRLLYAGNSSFGALEFRPYVADESRYEELVGNFEILKRQAKKIKNNDNSDEFDTFDTIHRIGGSAGGLRAKATVLFSPTKGEIVTDLTPRRGYKPCLLKFTGVEDGIEPNTNTLVEFVYHRMASLSGIHVPMSWIFEDQDGLKHLLVRRFDRNDDGSKPCHQITLCGVLEKDFRDSGICSYEEYINLTETLTMNHAQMVQAFRRAVFNIVFRNQDDHTKNHSFLMSSTGEWILSPAYDLTYSYDGYALAEHQMAFNSKTTDFDTNDIL